LLRDRQGSFSLVQAVRALRRLYPAAPPRFRNPLTLGASLSEVAAVELPRAGERPLVEFTRLGLYGRQGALPYYFTELLGDRAAGADPDTTLRDFLDLFNDRLIALYGQAWEQGFPPAAYERARSSVAADGRAEGAARRDGFIDSALALLGIGPVPGLAAETLVYYAGLLSVQPPAAAALEQLLGDYFDLPVRVQAPFARQADDPVDADDPRRRFRVQVGPMPRERYDQFVPDGSAFLPLLRLTRLYVGMQFDFDVRLLLGDPAGEGCVLGNARLNWTSWLDDPDEHAEGVVSLTACRQYEELGRAAVPV
jgi:type VI secretion system protein ImpH